MSNHGYHPALHDHDSNEERWQDESWHDERRAPPPQPLHEDQNRAIPRGDEDGSSTMGDGSGLFSDAQGDAFANLSCNSPNIHEEEDDEVPLNGWRQQQQAKRDPPRDNKEDSHSPSEYSEDMEDKDLEEEDDSSNGSSMVVIENDKPQQLLLQRPSMADDSSSDESSGYEDVEAPFVEEKSAIHNPQNNNIFLYAGIQLLLLSIICSVLAIVYRNYGKTTATP